MTDEQFAELMDCLRGISVQLEDLQRATNDISDKTPEFDAYTHKDVACEISDSTVAVVEALWDVEKAIRKMD
jgi:hypothetical protein